jgi:hypothetical protein
MQYTRVQIARVALGVASEDEVFWVSKCCKEKADCKQSVNDLRELAKIQPAGICIDSRTLIDIGDTHKTSDEESDHLMECHRCARLGQYIANMPNPAAIQRHVPMSLAAG